MTNEEIKNLDSETKLLLAHVEAILFTMGESVEVGRIAQALGYDEETVLNVINNLRERYEDESFGVQILELDGSFQMCTKPSMYESIIKITNVPKKIVLTDVLLETLSIIAYKQPITKQEIENIRGVNSDHSVNKLLEYNLICEVGRKNAPGRPCMFGTTEEFLRNFGISSLDELPLIKPETIEEFKSEAEDEMQMKFL
ncbi:MAG: SMC-Scp complex subunit ScpB [Lachnospiraceae bacterium]|jgi:segregation and condensation protein B|nr:SMC-Scp complex subunit ScpB [Lachnospiraceae bacterium]